jgi:long-chain acyl-CoA synthetase
MPYILGWTLFSVPHVVFPQWERMQAAFLGTRQRAKRGGFGAYTWQSYSVCSQRRTAIGSGLLGMAVQPGTHIGLFGVNSADWFLLDLAMHAYSLVPVPLYDTLGADVVTFICGHADLVVVCCAATLLPTLLQSLTECPSVRLVVCPFARLLLTTACM